MTTQLTIALAQMTQSVGDLAGNADAMLERRQRAGGADLIVYPELQLIGYPPEDLVLKPALIERAGDELLRLARATGHRVEPTYPALAPLLAASGMMDTRVPALRQRL